MNTPFKIPVGYRDNGEGHFIVFNFDDNDMSQAINSVGNFLQFGFPDNFSRSISLLDVYEKIYELQQDFKAEKREEIKELKNA